MWRFDSFIPSLNLISALAFSLSGLFTVVLGAVHFFFPHLLDFERAIPKDGPPLKPFRLWPIHYPTERSDVHGIAWVMNHAASYVLVSIGIFDLAWTQWWGSPAGRVICAWLAGWWLVRAVSQLYLGRRRGDWWILLGFAMLGIWHGVAAFL